MIEQGYSIIVIITTCIAILQVVCLVAIWTVSGDVSTVLETQFFQGENFLKKRATPSAWAASLHEYFLGKKNAEGVMLMESVTKLLSRKKLPHELD